MKGRWESNINVWSPYMCSQKWNCYSQNRLIMFCLQVLTLIYLWEIYIFPGSVCLFCCRERWGLILGTYINRSQPHKCGNWDWGRAIPRKGIHKWDFACHAAQHKKWCKRKWTRREEEVLWTKMKVGRGRWRGGGEDIPHWGFRYEQLDQFPQKKRGNTGTCKYLSGSSVH